MRTNVYTLLSAGDMSGNLTSAPQQLLQMQDASVQCVWTGTPSGDLALEISNDGVVWSHYTNSDVTVAGEDGNWTWNLMITPYNQVRLVWLSGSGSGSLSVTASIKGPA